MKNVSNRFKGNQTGKKSNHIKIKMYQIGNGTVSNGFRGLSNRFWRAIK